MKLNLLNTAYGLVPCYDTDYDEKKKLSIGKIYQVEIKEIRNIDFHRKYFALIHCAWEYVPEHHQRDLYNNSVEKFRKTIEIASGHCETIYDIFDGKFYDIPKSISFEKMDNTEFSKLYERVVQTLFLTVLKDISQEEFEKNLINF